MRGRLIVAIVLLGLLHAGVAQAAPVRLRSASVALAAGHTVTVSSSKGSVSFLGRTSGPTVFGVSEKRYRYAVGPRKKPLATVWLTVRTLPTGSQLVFARVASPRRTVPVTVALKSHATSFSAHDLGLRPSAVYDAHYGVDLTSGPYGWIDLSGAGASNRSVFLSKAYRFKDLKKSYAMGGSSSVKQLVSERSLVTAGRQKDGAVRVALGLVSAKDSCERYFLLTPRAIVDSQTTAALVATVTASEARWLDPRGSYKKAPYSIEPFTKKGYVRSLLEMRADSLREGYELTGSALFEDLLLNNEYSLALIRSSDGLWRSNYTSTWVKAESGIVAPYIDTRHNEGISLGSTRIADALAGRGVGWADGIRAWALPYATFLSGRAAAGAVLHMPGGFYFSDYYDTSGRAKSHASLNHSLGEMNYLLTQCGDASSTPLFALAMDIKSAVDDNGTQWIAPNGDLFYQRNVSGSFEGTDYPTVTYYDLLNSQQLLEKLGCCRDPIFDKLIASKQGFLGISSMRAAPFSLPQPRPDLMARDPLAASPPDDRELP